jgi:hypothetical protein
MRDLAAIAAVMAALLFGSGHAFAFQETPPPPPAEDADETPAPQAPAMQLGTPSGAEADQQAERKGLKLFGYTVLPKLDFGLDVLYGQDQQRFQLGAPEKSGTLEENGDVSVLGKVKRRF